MTGDAEEIVTVRLPAKDREAIARLVEEGAFRNRSDFLRYAVKAALAEHGTPARETPAPVLEIEGIDLPAQAPADRRRAGGRLKGGVGR